MQVPAGRDAAAPGRRGRWGDDQRSRPVGPRSSIRNAHSIHQRSRKRLSQDTYRRNSVRFLQQRRRQVRPGPQSAGSQLGKCWTRGAGPGRRGGVCGRGQRGPNVRALGSLCLSAGQRAPGGAGPEGNERRGWERALGMRAGGGASYPVPLSGNRGGAGDAAPETAAGCAPTAQCRPHPEPLQRQHEAEAGVCGLRPRYRPQMTLWPLRPLWPGSPHMLFEPEVWMLRAALGLALASYPPPSINVAWSGQSLCRHARGAGLQLVHGCELCWG